MKAIQNISRSILLFLSVMSLNAALAQPATENSNNKANDIKSIIENKHFVFKAQTALPLSGKMRQLTSDYDMKVSGDSLVTYLPYFGRAYAAPLDPSGGGIHFTSTDYNYQVQERKNGWNIILTPKDVQDVRELLLSVSKSGYASLNVTSNSRQSISFNGYVAKK